MTKTRPFDPPLSQLWLVGAGAQEARIAALRMRVWLSNVICEDDKATNMFVGLTWELLGGNSAQLHPYQTYSWGLMTALHAADSVDSCKLPRLSQSTLALPPSGRG